MGKQSNNLSISSFFVFEVKKNPKENQIKIIYPLPTDNFFHSNILLLISAIGIELKTALQYNLLLAYN